MLGRARSISTAPLRRRKAAAWLVVLCSALCWLVPTASRAGGLHLLSVGFRARIGEKNVLGRPQPESFEEYDLEGNFRSPWGWYSEGGWGLGINLLASVGALQGVGKTALVGSAIPTITVGRRDGRLALQVGAGAALLSRQRFGTQTFGGPVQFALAAGLDVPLYKHIGVGYRYIHYSDASLYGENNTGVDFHMLEVIYRL